MGEFLMNNLALVALFLASGVMLAWPEIARAMGGSNEIGTLDATRLMNGGPHLVPSDDAGKAKRKNEVRESFKRRFGSTATKYRAKLRELYGAERADKAQSAEAFEISEYGRRPNAEEIKKLFPFF